MKKCNNCGETKPPEQFHNKKSSKDGKQSSCKVCNNASARSWQKENPDKFEVIWKRNSYGPDAILKRKASRYGISIDRLKEMIDTSNGFCEICKREPYNTLVIDHCHKTLIVRGLLCEKCNQALGLFADNVEFLQNAISYLSKDPITQ